MFRRLEFEVEGTLTDSESLKGDIERFDKINTSFEDLNTLLQMAEDAGLDEVSAQTDRRNEACIALLEGVDFVRCGMGERIMRTETAATVAGAIILSQLEII